jgi:hypothetical protein
VAISVAWQTVASFTSAAALYTVPSASTASFGSYARDLVLNNSGTATIFIAANTNTAAATTTGSFQIPAGGTVLLTQCQVPAGTIINGTCPTTTGYLSIGYAANVNYF